MEQHPTFTSERQRLPDVLSEKQWIDWKNIVSGARRIVIVGHSNPDGDALGSSLGLADYLRALGKKDVQIVMPNPLPHFLQWVSGADEILLYERRPKSVFAALHRADLVFCLDFGSFTRIDADLREQISEKQTPLVVIDHHLSPDINASLLISFPSLSSTSELVFRLIWQLGDEALLSRDGAVAIYLGMMTDTGGFTYNSNDSNTFFIISRLLLKGIDKDAIYRAVYHTFSENRLRLQGYLLCEKMKLTCGGRAAFFTLTKEEQERFHFVKGDTEGFVNLPLQIKGVKLSVSLREDMQHHLIRVSIRSVDDVPCDRIATDFFSGGGHRNAAGGKWIGTIDEAIAATQKAIEAYASYLADK